jgi:hypothetical protein
MRQTRTAHIENQQERTPDKTRAETYQIQKKQTRTAHIENQQGRTPDKKTKNTQGAAPDRKKERNTQGRAPYR